MLRANCCGGPTLSLIDLLLPRVTQFVNEIVGVALLDLFPQRFEGVRPLEGAAGMGEMPVELVDAEPIGAVALQPLVEGREGEVDSAQFRQQLGCCVDSDVQLTVAIDPDAALTGTYDLCDLAGGDGLLGNRLSEGTDDLSVGLLEQVVANEFSEVDVLDARLIVEICGGPLCQDRKSSLTSSVVAQARKVELDVLKTARTIRLEAVDRLAEDPVNEVVDARRGGLVAVD